MDGNKHKTLNIFHTNDTRVELRIEGPFWKVSAWYKHILYNNKTWWNKTSDYCFHGQMTPDSKVHGANMGPTWVLSAPDGPQPLNLLSGTKLQYFCMVGGLSCIVVVRYQSISPVSFKVTSLALGQPYHMPVWGPKRYHKQNKTTHNITVCICCGIYCIYF